MSAIKRALLPHGAKPHRVISGAFRGLAMEMDPQSSMQFWAGLYERETYPWIARFGAGCASGVDVGAAKGELSLFLLRRTDAARVFAFEPSSEHEATFSRNLALNGLASDGRLSRHAEFAGDGQGETVRLDAFLAELASPVFVKIDVDGAETEVIEGMSGLFAGRRVRLLLETHGAELERRCVELLLQRGCRTRVIENAWWRALIRDQRPIGFNRWLVATNDPECPL